MNFLAINTVGKSTHLAISINDKVIYKSLEFSKHSENLFPLLEEVLGENKLSLNDFDCFAGVVGPGSFTGIRIGLSVIKAFAYVQKKHTIAVNSLEVLAYNIKKSDTPIVAVINAGAGLVYYQVFKKENSELMPQIEPKIDKYKHFLAYINSEYQGKVCYIYNQNGEKGEDYSSVLGESQDFSCEGLFNCVENKIVHKKYTDAIEMTPLYLRLSQAEQEVFKPVLVPAKLSNLDELLVLESQDDTWDLPWTKVGIEQSFANPNYQCYLLKSGNKTLGFVSLNLLVDEAEILRVVVLKEYRKMGLGEKMLKLVFDEIKKQNIPVVFLEVNNLNYPARNLYQKLGFKVVGERPDYYPEGQSALVMKCNL